MLAEIARTRNVAQFVSFSDGTPPAVRHCLIRGVEEGRSDAETLVASLIHNSRAGTVNVRTFDPHGKTKGSPFHYGVSDPKRVAELVSDAARRGLYSIVNETIDIHDGGVSGVSMPGLIEFAPDATPRVVEEEGVASAPPAIGSRILETVYGAEAKRIYSNRERIEFSTHPNRCGFRREHVIVWEVEATDDDLTASMPLVWPNRFSRHIGDKAFGLLVADAAGFLVPRTTVIPRKVRPFTFGTPTDTGETWIRTSPHEPRPGRYTTVQGWVDPFKLLRIEDPLDREIASVLDQEGVDARWSGATARESGNDVIEGVPGWGDKFMLGDQSPSPLPDHVRSDVASLLDELRGALGDCRIEWVHDGDSVWVLQLHRVLSQSVESGIRSSVGLLEYDPKNGLEALHSLVHRAIAENRGIKLTRRVGATSHVGEILRRSRVHYEM